MNKKLLKNIRDVKKTLSPHCNARVTTVNKIGNCWDMVQWFYEDGIANILSLNSVKKKYHVTYEGAHLMIMLLYKVDRQRIDKRIKEMINDMLQCHIHSH